MTREEGMQRLAELLLARADQLPRSQVDRPAVAFHEAGHAIAHAKLGLPIESVSIIPEGESSGRLVGGFSDLERLARRIETGRPPPGGPELLERHLVAILAGPTAETAYRVVRDARAARASGTEYIRSENGVAALTASAEQDLETADALAEALAITEHGNDPDRYIESAREKAHDLIVANLEAVEAVAEALLEHGTINSERVAAAIAE